MSGEEPSELVAPAPTEWGKNLRCCVTCRLVKTVDQFYDTGCENCHFLAMDGDRERIYDCTTTEFQVGGITGWK
jgi:transcription elongation factor SPT4